MTKESALSLCSRFASSVPSARVSVVGRAERTEEPRVRRRFLARFPGYRAASGPVRGGRARFRGFLSLPARLA